MSVGSLLTVFRLLAGGAGTVCTSDVLLFLGLGLDLVVFLAGTAASSEVDAVLQDILEVAFFTHGYNA